LESRRRVGARSKETRNALTGDAGTAEENQTVLLRRPVQIIVNLAVILLLVGLIGGGVLMLLPVKGPIGTLLGKMASSDRPWPAS
jgi:hypothetical protein